jgi:PAS domain S-box-containing protein
MKTYPDSHMKHFSEIAGMVDNPVAVVDKNGVLEYVNNAFARVTGMSMDGIIGRSLYELVEEGYLVDSVGIKVLQAKHPITMDVQYRNGSIVTWTCIPVFDKNEEISGVLASGVDITELLMLQEELKKSKLLKDAYYSRIKDLEATIGSKDNRIIYSSDKMGNIVKKTIKAAETDTSVFLWGESGVGKELLASLIHNSSRRKAMPYIPINCAAIPAELLESEFFGYEEGAFTGAKKGGKKGLFEEANKGTVFLDEIGELPHSLQSKLLRVLDKGELIRVGGNKKVPLDLRIIAATNLSQEQLLNDSKFRQDLFYRLSVVPIYICPLRERKEDVLTLVRHFLEEFNKKYKTNVKISNKMISRLYNYNWPGNVRELKNVIERLVILSEEGTVSDSEVLSQLGIILAEDQTSDISITGLMSLKTAVHKVEEMLIKRAYAEHGSIVKAAEALQINPVTIHRRIKEGLKFD